MTVPRTVLIVDDDSAVLMNLIAFLEDEGFDVYPAANGEQALEILAREENRPAVAVIDIRLPGIDGEELILQLRAAAPDLDFIIYTGLAGYALPPSLLAIGMREQDVLQKPLVDMQALCDAIERRLMTRSNNHGGRNRSDYSDHRGR